MSAPVVLLGLGEGFVKGMWFREMGCEDINE